MQGAAFALGTRSVECSLLLFGEQYRGIGNRGVEMDSTEGESLASVAIGKQSEVTDLHEASRQNMEQESTDELGRIESHDAASVVMSGVSPAEAHLAVFKAEKSSVGDGDAMGVAKGGFE